MVVAVTDAQGEQKLVLHKQNAITVNPGKILDEVKRKRAGRMKKVVRGPW